MAFLIKRKHLTISNDKMCSVNVNAFLFYKHNSIIQPLKLNKTEESFHLLNYFIIWQNYMHGFVEPLFMLALFTS